MGGSVGQGFGVGSALSDGVPSWLMREYLDSFVAWRDEAAEVRNAYDNWAGVQDPDGATAFVAYRAALDREEQAAAVLRGWAERISELKAPSIAM